jgi:hypothetical protein
MLKLKSLQLQLENLKVVFNEAIGNQDISIEELRKIREQISGLENLIEQKKILFGSGSNN